MNDELLNRKMLFLNKHNISHNDFLIEKQKCQLAIDKKFGKNKPRYDEEK